MLTLYRGLIRLYPQCFQLEFGDEMAAVYSEALADARGRGLYLRARFYVREFAGLVRGALAQHFRGDAFDEERTFTMRNGFRYSSVAIAFMAISFVVVLMAISKAADIASGYSHVIVVNLVRPLAVCCAFAVGAGVLGWLIAFATGRSGEDRLAHVETWQKSA